MKHSWMLILPFILLFAVSYAFGSDAVVEQEKSKVIHTPKPGIKSVKQSEPNIPEEYKGLEKTFAQYWDLVIKKEFAKAYELESSEYRKSNPYAKDKYENLLFQNVKLTAVKAFEVEKTSAKEVVVKGRYYYEMGALKFVRLFSDNWTREGEDWKHIPTEGQFKK